MTESTDSVSSWQKNRKWIILGGGLILLLCLVSLVCVGGIGLSVFSLIKSSDAYQLALQEAQSNPAVIAALGEPIEAGWWVTGSINVSGPGGDADISFPLTGSENSGTLYVVATKEAGQWHFQTLELAVDGQSGRINLLE